MGFSTLRSAILCLIVLASTTSATISLSNFTPRIDDLPSQCAAVYNAKIDGCVATDFTSSDGSTPVCSTACVQGLTKIQDAVTKSCADVDVSELSIIGVFQNGLGLRALCPGVTSTTKSSTTAKATSTQAPARSSTEAAATTTSTSSFEMILSTGTESASTSATDDAQASSSSSSTGGLLVDPSATGSFTTSAQATGVAPSSSAGATTSRAPNSQLSNAGSGGGSPFDVVAVGSSSQLRIFDMTVASLIATAVLFFACA